MSHTLDNQTRFNGAVSSEIPGVKPQDTMLDRWLAVSFTIIPLLGFIIAMVLLWKDGIGVLEVGTLVGMYTVNGIGISVGFHRLFAHCAFETNKAIQVILAIAGSTAGQNSLLRWVASHRCHHQHSDHPGDPHSPLLHGERIFDRLRGLWHAHAGWVLVPERASVRRYAPDLLQDTLIVKVSRLYLVWVVVGLAIPALVGGLLMWTWMGALRGLLWGGFVRLFLFYNVTASVNSICHVYGTRPFRSDGGSRNNIIVALMGFGEGWHNNHHAFPYSAKYGLKWWQIDLGEWVIRTLESVQLVWNVKVPTAHMMEKKRCEGISRSVT